MKVKVIVASLVMVAIVGVWWGLAAAKPGSTTPNTTSNTGAAQPSPSLSQTNPVVDDQGGIQVGIRWEKQDAQSGTQKFLIELNNHALDLDSFDFSRNVRLQVDSIDVPVSIKAANNSGGGHHVSAEIIAQGSELTKLKNGSRVSLIVENLGDTPARTFSWEY
ncbi:hypothetical protein JCM15765_10040 [Paradesulfitobacterium aromaticivorans]